MGDDQQPAVPRAHIAAPEPLELPQGEPVGVAGRSVEVAELAPPRQESVEPPGTGEVVEVADGRVAEEIGDPRVGSGRREFEGEGVEGRGVAQEDREAELPGGVGVPGARGELRVAFVEPARHARVQVTSERDVRELVMEGLPPGAGRHRRAACGDDDDARVRKRGALTPLRHATGNPSEGLEVGREVHSDSAASGPRVARKPGETEAAGLFQDPAGERFVTGPVADPEARRFEPERSAGLRRLGRRRRGPNGRRREDADEEAA